jgi:NhaP-type Na+/H+ or K+/H+ antiporter
MVLIDTRKVGEDDRAMATATTANIDALPVTLALVGVVVLVAALLSGVVERTGLPQVAIFLALGAALGPAGLGLLDVGLESAALRVVATLSLVLVLFTDAVSIDLAGLRRHGPLAARVLGPGTLATAAVIGVAGWALLGLPPAAAAVLGAALASTDPVLLRGLLRRRGLPAGAREALRLESGLNDGVLLPIVLVAMAFMAHDTPLDATGWGSLALDLLLLGPGAGVAVGLLAVAALDLIRRRIGVRRDYESLYSLGIALTAYAAAEAVHGSGFVAAFVAGLTISALDVELCDCFLEYGETTAEMALLFAFVLFGASLIWMGIGVATPIVLLFAVLALLVRPVVFVLSLLGSTLDRRGRLLVAWFGPRGLSSLLLVLLPVFAGVPGGEQLFSLCCLVVLLSVVVHGGTPAILNWATRQPSSPPAAPRSPQSRPLPVLQPDSSEAIAPLPNGVSAVPDGAPEAPPVGPTPTGPAPAAPAPEGGDDGESGDRISLADLRRLDDAGQRIVLLDVRTERTYGRGGEARGAVRLPPDHVAERAHEMGLDHEAWLVAYCA